MMYLLILLAFPLGALTACIRKDTTLICKDFRDLASRTWRDVEIFRINRLSSGVNLKKFKVMHSLLRCDDIIGQKGSQKSLRMKFSLCPVQYLKKSRETRGHSQKWRREMPFMVLLLEAFWSW
eukprot:XP_011431777.1 PREDICTED: uncharacterized protein LOC105331335 [Crassostrea gigas]